jgi:hypothetical protein
LHRGGFAPKLCGVTLARCLAALLLLLVPALVPAQEPGDIEQIGPWRLICYRGDKLYGHAFESCRAYAIFNEVGVYLDRNSKGIIGYLGGKHCPNQSNVFRINPGDIAPGKKSRAANTAKVIDKAFKTCGQPPPAPDLAPIALVLQRSDGLSADWVAQ